MVTKNNKLCFTLVGLSIIALSNGSAQGANSDQVALVTPYVTSFSLLLGGIVTQYFCNTQSAAVTDPNHFIDSSNFYNATKLVGTTDIQSLYDETTLTAAHEKISLLEGKGFDALNLAAQGIRQPLQKLLKMGVNVNAVDENGITALMQAAFKEDAATVKLLLDAGAHVNAVGERNGTPLMWASAISDAATVKLLLDAGAQVNAVDDEGNTALIVAAFSGDAAKVKLLLDAQANIHAVDDAGRTALTWATHKNHNEIIEILKNAQARESYYQMIKRFIKF